MNKNKTNQTKEIDELRNQIREVKRESEAYEDQLRRAQKEEEQYAVTFYGRIQDVQRKVELYNKDKKLMQILERRYHNLKQAERDHQEMLHAIEKERKKVKNGTEAHLLDLQKKIRRLEESK